MTIKLSDLKKAEATSTLRGARVASDEPVTAIVRVEREDYVPPGVEVRMRIDKLMFTGTATLEVLERLDRDPLVKSVALPKTIKPI